VVSDFWPHSPHNALRPSSIAFEDVFHIAKVNVNGDRVTLMRTRGSGRCINCAPRDGDELLSLV
jgi:hypothetical protein